MSSHRWKPRMVICVWLLGVDGGTDIKRSLLVGIYKRISRDQLQPDSDHTAKLIAVDSSISGIKPVLYITSYDMIQIYILLVYSSAQNLKIWRTRLNPFARSWFYNATAVRGTLWWLCQSHSVNYANHQHSPFARRRHDVANSIFSGIVW